VALKNYPANDDVAQKQNSYLGTNKKHYSQQKCHIEQLFSAMNERVSFLMQKIGFI
jgi:hypothetical protein